VVETVRRLTSFNDAAYGLEIVTGFKFAGAAA
jgi:hypothetical protein